MIKKASIILLITLNLIAYNTVIAASPDDFVEDFLTDKMYVLVTKKIDNLDKYYVKNSEISQRYLMFTKLNLLEDYIIAFASNDYVIEKVVPEVKILRSSQLKATAKVDAILKSEIYWNATNALGEPIMGIKTESHLFTLNKENGSWKIISDRYMTCRGHSDEAINQDYRQMTETVEKLKKEALHSLNRSKHSKPTRLTLSPSHYATGTTDNLSTTSAADSRGLSVYNRQAAYDWAHTYWKNYSPLYVNLGDQEGEGGDCTNFVSQCVRAGGAENDKKGSFQWYYDNRKSYSWTWSTARGLNNILLGNHRQNEFGPKATEKIIAQDQDYNTSIGEYVTLGDIIQYEWSSATKIKHSAIIVAMLYNSSKERFEPVISTHSSDSWYLPWTKNAYKTHFVHITEIN